MKTNFKGLFFICFIKDVVCHGEIIGRVPDVTVTDVYLAWLFPTNNLIAIELEDLTAPNAFFYQNKEECRVDFQEMIKDKQGRSVERFN